MTVETLDKAASGGFSIKLNWIQLASFISFVFLIGPVLLVMGVLYERLEGVKRDAASIPQALARLVVHDTQIKANEKDIDELRDVLVRFETKLDQVLNEK